MVPLNYMSDHFFLRRDGRRYVHDGDEHDKYYGDDDTTQHDDRNFWTGSDCGTIIMSVVSLGGGSQSGSRSWHNDKGVITLTVATAGMIQSPPRPGQPT